MSNLDGRLDWPLLINESRFHPSDERKPGVYLLSVDYSIKGEEKKRTAEFIGNQSGGYWTVFDWLRFDQEGKGPQWVSRYDTSVTIPADLVDQLSKLRPA